MAPNLSAYYLSVETTGQLKQVIEIREYIVDSAGMVSAQPDLAAPATEASVGYAV